MSSIDRHAALAGRRHWLVVAAAAVLLATLGVWLALPASLPTADAAMQRAVGELSRPIDRRFHVEVVGRNKSAREIVRHEFELVTQPGMRFVVDGQFAFVGIVLGKWRIGCDGEELWVLPVNQRGRRAGPLAEHEKLLDGLGEVLDVGYLDVHSLVRRLPADFRLRTVGRVTGADGRELLRIEALRRRVSGWIELRSAELLVDEATGMVTRLEAELELGRGRTRQLVIEYRGTVAAGTVDYRRPW